jgi:mannose-6-phosphate isomerase-like protein (cupin superfamily)
VTAFDLEDVRARRVATGSPYLEFVRTTDLSVGLYELPAGGVDRQSPHTEDEIYYVVRGAATIRVDSTEHRVGPGSIIFVPAGVVHQFHDIEADLVIVVAFGPAEASRRGADGSD